MLASIMRLKSRLSDLIEPFELLDQLLSLQVLTQRQYNKIRKEDKAAEEQNEALLELLTSEDQCIKFLEALLETDQQHITNFIIQNGGQTLDDFWCAMVFQRALLIMFVHLPYLSVCHNHALC